MQLGIFTGPFDPAAWPLERIAAWAGANGIDCLEVFVPKHLDPALAGDRAARDALLESLRAAGVSISALSYYALEFTDADPDVRREHIDGLLATIAAAESLGVDTVCTMAGGPAPGKTRMQTIREDLPAIFAPVLAEAERRGVRLALENWAATNIQHLEHWRAIFEVLPQENFGLNFDPTHLVYQQIDYLAAASEFAGRIFHTHAKDVIVDEARLRRVGVLGDGWWRCVLPGGGRFAWGEYLGRLRDIGFDGVVAIEHEDNTLSPEDGFRMGAAHLRGLIG